MNTNLIAALEQEIDNTLGLTAICRGEWCRELEAKVDVLGDKLVEVGTPGTPGEGTRIHAMSNKIMKSYHNLGGEFRL